jgi:hypothetical protein
MDKEARTAGANLGVELELMYALKKFVINKNGEEWFVKMFPYDAGLVQLLDAARNTYYNTLKPWPDTRVIKTKTEEDIT